MDTCSIDSFCSEVTLTRLDHSPQKEKAFVGRSGALSNRRPPSRSSRSSRQSLADSLHLIDDDEEDVVIPRVVNIEVQLEGDTKECITGEPKGFVKDYKDFKGKAFTFREQLEEPKLYTQRAQEHRRNSEGFSANQEIRRKLFETRHRRSIGSSNPLLSFSTEAEESFWRIKEEIARLAAKSRSSSDISESRPVSDTLYNYSHQDSKGTRDLKDWNDEREALLESASVILEKGDENRSSSEADVVISDRESIADSGLVNRRTVIKIHEKKSKSSTNVNAENPTPLWVRDLQTRHSLRGGKEETRTRVIPISIDPEFEGGINVSIVNQSESPRKDSTSRMYVRLSDSENRPSRASAFNVRRTIEKRQIQQERRERRALREQIREQLRSLSEGRERKDSTGSHVSSTNLSQNSVRSKSMSSLDQDQDSFRSESPLFKVQSSPTLEKEKEGIRSYLFGASNLTDSGETSHDLPYGYREKNHVIRKEHITQTNDQKAVEDKQNKYSSDSCNIHQWTQSWNSLNANKLAACEGQYHTLSKSADTVHISDQTKIHQEQQGYPIRYHKLQEPTERAGNFTTNSDTVVDNKSADNSVNIPKGTVSDNTDSLPSVTEGLPESRPIPPPRKHRLSLSTGHITLEGEEKPSWIRLAKERRSLRAAKTVDELSDRASTASKEPEWVARARKKLEALNVTLTSTTDFNSVSSQITESSSAWSRGGLDALDDLREEASRIGVELAEEAAARVNEDLGLKKDNTRMLEHNTDRSRDPSSERPRVSFEPSAVESSDGDSSRKYRTKKSQKDEVRFGDLKHDWGGVQTKVGKSSNGKQKEMRFGDIKTRETVDEDPPEKTKETWFGDHMRSSANSKIQNGLSSPNENLPVMRFGDTPLNLFPASPIKGVQSSSKFESVAGPDPTKMTAEQLNQNVEEYDFPIPTGKEDVTEFMKFLEESLKKADIVPEVISSEDNKPKPKSILKRRSVENVLHELKREEKSEFLQKVEHRKSASFDWDTVENQVTSPSPTTPEAVDSSTETTKTEAIKASASQNKPISSTEHNGECNDKKKPAKIFSFTFSSDQKFTPETTLVDMEEDTIIQQKTEKEAENKRRIEGMKVFTIITNPSDVSPPDQQEMSQSNGHTTEAPSFEPSFPKAKSRTPKIIIQSKNSTNNAQKTPEISTISSWKKLVTQNLSSNNADRRKSLDKVQESSPKQNLHQIRLDVIDDDHKKLCSQKKDEEKRRSSLLEWEALQRQRLEDEEKNRINKNLSIKPVSAKIKELVKMHGSFMSMFSKDKKTDINGTVDGKDDIVFRKVSSPNLPFEMESQTFVEPPLPMKSPYIVKKLLNPSKHYSAPEDCKSSKTSHKDIPKSQSSGQRTPRTSRRNNTKPLTVRERSQSPAKSHIRERSQSPAKPHSEKDISHSSVVSHSVRERSPSPAKSRKLRERSQSPAAFRNVRARSPSPAKPFTVKEKSQSPAKSRIVRGRSPSPANRGRREKSLSTKASTTRENVHPPENKFMVRERSQSPVKSQIQDRTVPSVQAACLKDEFMHPEVMGNENKERIPQIPFDDNKDSFTRKNSTKEAYKSRQTPSVSASYPSRKNLDPAKLKNEKLINEYEKTFSKTSWNHMPKESLIVPSLQSEESPSGPSKPDTVKEKISSFPSSRSDFKRDDGVHYKNDGTEKFGNYFKNEKRNSKERSSIKDPKNRKEWLNKMLNTIESDDVSPLKSAETHVQKSTANLPQTGDDSISSKNFISNEAKYENRAALSYPTSKLSVKKDVSDKTSHQSRFSSSVTSPISVQKSPLPTMPSYSRFSKFSAPDNLSNSLKAESSPPSTPTSLSSSVREALSTTIPQPVNSRRGPVSLSSILGDSSSRSSSLTSTPLHSPRVTPERVIRKDSLDMTPKLDVIPERNVRESVQILSSVDEQKENIAPLSNIAKNKHREDSDASDFSSSVPRHSSSRLNTHSGEKKKDVNEDKNECNSRESSSLTGTSHLRQFTFGKPSVTMKTMAAGVDFQRVSSTKNQNFDIFNFEKDYTVEDELNHSFSSNSYPRDNKLPITSRFSKERSSLRANFASGTAPNDESDLHSSKVSKDRFSSSKESQSSNLGVPRKNLPLRTLECSERLTPDRDEGPVSLASILSKNIESKYTRSEEPTKFQFKPNLSFSKELNDISHNYRKDMEVRQSDSAIRARDSQTIRTPSPSVSSNDTINQRFMNTNDKHSREASVDPDSKESTPVRDTKGLNKSRPTKDKNSGRKHQTDLSCTCAPKSLPKKSSSSEKQRNRVVRRNSSLKRNRPEDSNAAITPKRDRRDSEDDPADIKKETIVQKDDGWTKTKTTVRRARLGSFEKTRQIVRTNSGKTKKERTFKADASKALEDWAAKTSVQGKLMKKEGQRFSHETEEEVKGGQRTSRSVARRVIRRGSRRLSNGGELLTETKEMSSEGVPKEGNSADGETPVERREVLAIDDGLSRKMKTSTDGERYVTESVSNKDGKQTYTTEGVNNKTTNSVEVIGGDDFEAKREVQGKTGHRVLVERSKDNLGRPSTVVKKITSQSRVIITKTKRKTPVVV